MFFLGISQVLMRQLDMVITDFEDSCIVPITNRDEQDRQGILRGLCTMKSTRFTERTDSG